jgi:hypothetical protein
MIFNKSLSYLVATLFAEKAFGITHGELDGEGHPHVGLMVAKDKKGDPLWRCTGTLISDKVFLTAGHCIKSPAASAEIWFDADVESGIPDNGYPYKGDVASKSIHIHPNYDPNAFYLHDLGIVKLKTAVKRAYYGELPSVGLLDDLVSENHKSGISFTAVGYGLQFTNPHFSVADRVRYVAYPDLIQINTPGFVGDFSILTTNNAASVLCITWLDHALHLLIMFSVIFHHRIPVEPVSVTAAGRTFLKTRT